jgi:hypothetical protein
MRWAPSGASVVAESEQLEERVGAPSATPLPIRVNPVHEEVLLSWLARLAAEHHRSLRALGKRSLSLKKRPSGKESWWSRPPPTLLDRISEISGVSVLMLRELTQHSFSAVYRDDEASGRFTLHRYEAKRKKPWPAGYAICSQCLAEDVTPHLRRNWLIGWLAACSYHASILTTHCPWCRRQLLIPALIRMSDFSSTLCPRCSASLIEFGSATAHESVLRLQQILLRGKREGVTEFPSLGRLTWCETVALIDVLLGTGVTGTTLEERGRISRQFLEFRGESSSESPLARSRHDSLRFLAWLLDGWPDSTGARIARDLLRRGLNTRRNRLSQHLSPRWRGYPWSPGPHDIEPTIQHRLGELLQISSSRSSADEVQVNEPSNEFAM